MKIDYKKVQPIKDPVRYPKIQSNLENRMKDNYKKSIDVMMLDITRILTEKK